MTLPGPSGVLSFVEAGTGSPSVVLVHGLAGTSAWWEATTAHLAERHHVVVPDLRGHGSSGAPLNEDYSLAGHVADLTAVLDKLSLDRVVLVGHSFGASVALATAVELGSTRVAGLVLVDAAGDFSTAPPGAIEQFLGALHSDAYADLVTDAFTENLVRATDATKSLVLAGVERTSPVAMQGCYTALLRWNPGRALAGWKGPLLLIGDAGNESGFSLHAQHARRPVHLVQDASHWLHLDQPAAFHAVLDGFLGALDAPDT